MAGYRYGSKWSDLNELRCLLAYKQLKNNSFPRGMQTKLAKEISKKSGLLFTSVMAKISNYKSVAGDNNHSNASKPTRDTYNNYRDRSVEEIEKEIQEIKKLKKANSVK